MNSSSHIAAVEQALFDSVKLVPGMIIESALFGVLSLLVLFSTVTLFQRGIEFRPRLFMLVATLTMYVASGTHWGLNLYTMMREIRDSDGWAALPIQPRYRWSVASTIALSFNFWISDVVVMWRACVLWAWHRYVKLAFIVLLTAPVLLAIIDVSVSRPASSFIPNAYGLSALFVSLFSNLWATSLVGYKAWVHRKNIQVYIGNESTKSAASSILVILTESGFLYCGTLAVFIVASVIGTKSYTFFTYVISCAAPQLVGLYPTIIILLVAFRKTHCDQSFTYSTPTRSGLVVEPMVFAAVSHTRSTMISTGSAIGMEERHGSRALGSGEDLDVPMDEQGNRTSSRVDAQLKTESSRASLSSSLV
ncbi:hypothetical protein C8R44DRAFT_783409 [Mycena epipterygia]|nr:hypothetical protein C8R44DRAFT_783409 [Mycena epipterygia]